MGGGNKPQMKEAADRHFEGVRQILPNAKRLILFDFDTSENAFHPPPDNPTLVEWKRRNIENYLLVPSAWKRAVASLLTLPDDDLLMEPIRKTVDDFFAGENLTLPRGQTWSNVSAKVFGVVNGKTLLFEDKDSLFIKLRKGNPSVDVLKEIVADNMRGDEIHEDIHDFFRLLNKTVAKLET